jgi:hypothetical protein
LSTGPGDDVVLALVLLKHELQLASGIPNQVIAVDSGDLARVEPQALDDIAQVAEYLLALVVGHPRVRLGEHPPLVGVGLVRVLRTERAPADVAKQRVGVEECGGVSHAPPRPHPAAEAVEQPELVGQHLRAQRVGHHVEEDRVLRALELVARDDRSHLLVVAHELSRRQHQDVHGGRLVVVVAYEITD